MSHLSESDNSINPNVSTDSIEATNSANPNLSDVTEENLEKIKGDAIGDTLYSERSVLKILIKLNQIFIDEWTDELETELCLLWDMTLDKDVVNFIAKQNFIDLSSDIIKYTENVRLTEILVGIQGNLCCVEEVRHQFPSTSLDILLSLFETRPDALTLIQVVRLIQFVSWDLHSQNCEGHWLDNEANICKLSSQLAFVLYSSTNNELIRSSLELVDTLCRLHAYDKDYSFFFSTPEMVKGLVECWAQVMGDWGPEDDFPSKTHHKMAEHWAAILSTFTSHPPGRLALGECGESVGGIATKLITRTFQGEDHILLACVSIMEAIVRVYFNERALIKILEALHSASSQGDMNESDGDSNEGEVIEYIENYCVSVALFVNRDILQNALTRCNENHVLLFWKAVNDRQPDTMEPGERSI